MIYANCCLIRGTKSYDVTIQLNENSLIVLLPGTTCFHSLLFTNQIWKFCWIAYYFFKEHFELT